MNLDDLSALLGDDLSTDSGADIWVVGADGRLVAEARRLADGLGCYVQVVVGAEDEAPGAFAAGADRVHVVPAGTAYVETQRPEFVLFPEACAAEAARYAQRVGAGLLTGARTLSVEPDSRALLGTHAVYSGAYFHEVAVTSPVKVATVLVEALPEPFTDAGRTGEVTRAETEPEAPRVRDVGPADYTPPEWRPLEKARVIVAAGRGVRDEAGFALAREVAERLGAELAGDRSALSSGWVDEAHEVGVTGQEVSPDVYLAIGIQGDTLHNAAIAGARRVIAVHARADAPIFQAADVAVVAEPQDWMAALLAALEKT